MKKKIFIPSLFRPDLHKEYSTRIYGTLSGKEGGSDGKEGGSDGSEGGDNLFRSDTQNMKSKKLLAKTHL